MFLIIFGLYLDLKSIMVLAYVIYTMVAMYYVSWHIKMFGITCHGSYDAKVIGIRVIIYGFVCNDYNL